MPTLTVTDDQLAMLIESVQMYAGCDGRGYPPTRDEVTRMKQEYGVGFEAEYNERCESVQAIADLIFHLKTIR